MKTRYASPIIFVLAVVVLVFAAMPCRAEEQQRRGLPDDETVGRIMKKLAETDAEKVKELEALRESEPEKFAAELRRLMRRRFRDDVRGPREDGDMKGGGRRDRRPYMVGDKGGRGPRGGGRNIRERHREYIEWLEKEYPDEAGKLAKLREEKPELYMRQLRISQKKYGRIAEASRDNPKLAGILKESLQLRGERYKLLRRLKAVTDEEEKKRLTKELEDVLGQRFDLIVQQKQAVHEQMLKRLEKLRLEVKEKEAEVEKWKDAKFKSETVNKRLNELLSDKKKFEWR